MSNNKTKKLINKITTLSMSLVLFVTIIFTIVSVIKINSSSNDVLFDATTDVYSSNEAHITDPNLPSSNETITMTDAYANYSSIGNNTIVITSAEELFIFSRACSENTAYLSKNYKLVSNINYDINNQFIPIGYNGTPFSGTFDGNGFEISNLKMVEITTQINNETSFANMYYYAMFSENTGTIKDLGIVESRNAIISVELDKVVTSGGVANLVGHNQTAGKVQNCYYRDLRDMIDEEIGLAVYGGYRIAGLVYLNDGTFTDCYVAVSTVANHKINGYESLCGICYQDNKYNAATSNLYYYDGSIATYREITGGIEITYKDEVFSDATFLNANQNVGVYCSSVEVLNSNYDNNTWFIPADYGTASTYVKNPTPILRGLNYSIVNNKFVFTINNVEDFLYMFELMNGSDFFAGDSVVYEINSDIDLKDIYSNQYMYDKIITSSIKGIENSGSIQPTLVTNSKSSYPTIYNFDCIDESRKTTTLGIDAYGLFPFLGGEVSYLNIIPNSININNIEATNNVKGIAAVSGYVEKGKISHVNVYVTTTHVSKDIKEFYLGGVVGVLGGEGTVENCTASGSYTMNRFQSQAITNSAYTGGIAIGGVVGYICETYGSVKDSLSAVNMTLNMNSNQLNYQIGGVVGAAYTIQADGLENVGTINVGTSTAEAAYKNLYLGGVIGRHLGVKEQVKNFTNQGNVTLYANNTTTKTYLAGIENADILTQALSTGLVSSTDKTKDGKYRFMASSLTNRANILSGSKAIVEKIEYTSGLNLLSENGFVSELSGIYNLNYTEKYNSSATKTVATLGNQSIDLVRNYKYSGALNVINSSNSSAITNVSTVYNLRNIDVTSSEELSGSRNYEIYGTVRGKYINYVDVRNEGNITTTFNKNIGTTNDFVRIILAGVFEEVSEGCSADEVFNGGNISLTYSNSYIRGSVVASGICYKNKGYDVSTINQFNPSLNEFDSKAKGALNNVINNGSITVDNPTNFATISDPVYTTVMSANNQSELGSSTSVTYSSGYNITGDVLISGVVTYNEAPITNTFNLGDMFAANYIINTETEREINVSGIISLNIGKYAYVLNSANNGNLKGLNLSSSDTYQASVNVAGIIARNDEQESGADYSSNTTNPHSQQIVSFTINYGDVFSYNYKPNIQTTSNEPMCKSAGIVAMGLLRTANVMNYGNIYSSETASGIFGLMLFSKFEAEMTSNKVNIANTINYGNVYMLTRGYNHVHGDSNLDYKMLTYLRLKALTTSNIVLSDNTKGNIEAFTEVTRNTFYVSLVGSVFGLANYASSNNSKNINIRYLISFNDKCEIVGATVAAPDGISVATNTLYSAHISTNAATGAYQNDKWINNYVEYAPLTTGSVSGNFVTNISSTGVVTTAAKTYYGIFNSNFEFAKAILGKTNLDFTTNPTDAYLTDYFQFVGFKYINPVLFEKIGWQTFAYSSAAFDFATNVANVKATLNKSNNYSSYSSQAKDAFAWMYNLTSDNLNTLVQSLAENESHEDLLTVLQYIYSDDSASNIYITTSLREEILNYLVTSDSQYGTLLSTVLKYQNGYSSTLAKSIIDNEDAVKTYIDSYIDTMSDNDLSSLLDTYINYLSSNNNSYFNYSNSEQKRIAILTELFANISDARFYRELVSSLGISDTTITDTAKLINGYETLSEGAKKTLFETIITYNYNNGNRLETYLNDMASNIDFYKDLNEKGYNVSSLSEIYTKADLNSGSSSTSEDIIDERIKLWNLVKDTTIFQNYFNTQSSSGVPATTYFKATEYNNTYQSVTEPHNDGAYYGATPENRLSYLYTTTITPSVYFYGPYTAASATFNATLTNGQNITSVNTNITNISGNATSGYASVFHSEDSNIFTSNTTIKGRNNSVTYNQALNNSILMYYDLNNEQLGEAKQTMNYRSTSFKGFNAELLNIKALYLADPLDGQSYQTSDWSGVQFGPTNATMTVASTGETFSLNNAQMTGIYYTGAGSRTLSDGRTVNVPDIRIYIMDEFGSWHPIFGSITFNGRTSTDFDSNYQVIYSYLAYLYGIKYYTSTATTSLHSTGRTGIYRKAEPWGDNAQYFTWKQKQTTMVFTSQYINYSKTDLLKLDGVLTEYDQKTYSDDERSIINTLFNTYFLTSGRYQGFKRVIQAALMQMLGNDPSIGSTFISNFFVENIYTGSRTALGTTPFEYLYYASGTTVKSHLMGLYSISNDNKSLLIYDAAGNQEKYIGLLKKIKAAYDMETNANYAQYSSILDYLVTHQGYITNDKIVMSNFSTMSLTDLQNYFAALDDNQDVTISNLYDITSKMSAFTGVSTYSPASSYNYGLKFTSMTLTPASTDNKVIFVAKSTGASSTLVVGGQNVEITGINSYMVDTNGVTSLSVTSNSDVIVYAIEFIQYANITNKQTTLTGTVNDTVDGNNHTSYFTVTKAQIEAQINTAIQNEIGNSAFYEITSYSVVANISVTSTVTGSPQMWFTNSNKKYSASDLYNNSEFTCTQNTTTNTTFSMQESYYDENIYAVQAHYDGNNVIDYYQFSYWRYISAVSFTITYNYISEVEYVTVNDSVTSQTVSNLYTQTTTTGNTYTSNSTAVNATSFTFPTEATIKQAIATSASTTVDKITITALSGVFVVRHSQGGFFNNPSYYLNIYDSNRNRLGTSTSSVSRNTNANVSVSSLMSYYGTTLKGTYNNSYNNGATIVSYTYTATYTLVTDNCTNSITVPSLNDVRNLVLSDSRYTSWNSNLTITSATLYVTVKNASTEGRTIYLLDGNTRISGVGGTNVSVGATADYSFDLTQHYGSTINIRYGTYDTLDTKLSFVSYYYVVNYTDAGYQTVQPSATITNNDLYKNRLLNLDIIYSDVQNKYFCYILKSSTNYDAKYKAYAKANLTTFSMVNTGTADSPVNPLINTMDSTDKINFAKVILKNNNEALYYAIENLCNTNDKLLNVMKIMNKASSGYAFVADAITKLASMTSGSTDLIDKYSDVSKTLIASYLVADYRNIYNQNRTANNSKFYSIVNNVNSNATGTSESGTSFNGNINYISSTGVFNATKFDLFTEYVLGGSVASSGYGIFALAASRGIKNGSFIPDNIDLISMDAYYDKTAKQNNVSYIKLLTTSNPSWRDNLGTSTADYYVTTDVTSVNYHIRVEMKQLVKAISNVIFELDLDCDDTTLYSSTDQIDYEDKIITYYVSDKYMNYIKNVSELEIVKLVYADTAEANKSVGGSINLVKTYSYDEVSVTSNTFDSTKHYIYSNNTYTLASSFVEGTKYYVLAQINVANAITITPEEHAYTANYSIRFIRIDNAITSFAYNSMYYLKKDANGDPTSEYETTTNVINIPYYGARVTFKVEASLPDGMDMKSFFSITGQNENETWSFDADAENNGLISNGVAYIVINVDISMSQGNKAFVLNLYGTSRTVNLTKDANRNALITSFEYEGTDYTSTIQSSKAASSTILFGRAFNYTDLTASYIKTTDSEVNSRKTYYVQNGSNNSYSYTMVLEPVDENIATYYEVNPDFYLYSFSISPNATVEITATKSVDSTTQLMTYVVTYLVKSESGSTQTYTHTLTEHNYFDNNSTYGTLYKAGEAVDDSGIYKTTFKYGDDDINADEYSDLIYDASDADNFVAVIFNRGYEPQYRIRYNLSYFYGDVSHYSVTEGASNPSSVSPQNTYAGITVTVEEENEPGVYKFNYVYTNTGQWTSEGSYVKLSEDAVFDSNETYYELNDDGTYSIRTVTARTFARLKDSLYTYQIGGVVSTYTRTYSFPALYIVKDYAIDALFHKLSFLDESLVLGGTASVMLPTTPISAGPLNTDSDAVIYNTVFSNPAENDIIINPNSIEYSDSAKSNSVTDYYTVGTVSDTDLEYYAPTIKTEKHAQVFKYTTLTKLKTYGADNNQTAKDSTILSTRDDMLLYVPFKTGTGSNIKYEVFLVLVDSNMNWKKVYPKNFNGIDQNDSKVLKTYTNTFGIVDAEKDPTLTEFSIIDSDTNVSTTYRIAEFAGSTDVSSADSKNISLYMDYIGDPLDDHFWFISYVVFSEYYLNKGKTDANNDGIDDLGAIRFYHISIVDASNTVYFDVSLYAPVDFRLDDIYMTFAENVYDRQTSAALGSYQLSCYLEKAKDEDGHLIYGEANTEEEGLILYRLKFSMAALPAGYFSFYLDLPNGYGAVCYTNKDNELDTSKNPGNLPENKDTYLPHTTIIPITIGLKIIVSELTDGTTSVWAVNTSDLYTRRITYSGEKTF